VFDSRADAFFLFLDAALSGSSYLDVPRGDVGLVLDTCNGVRGRQAGGDSNRDSSKCTHKEGEILREG
jgi:hypothetical protein